MNVPESLSSERYRSIAKTEVPPKSWTDYIIAETKSAIWENEKCIFRVFCVICGVMLECRLNVA